MTAPQQLPTPGAPPLLLERVLAEQAELTAVDRFAQRHADVDEPLLASQYRELIPLRRPGAGEQLAFRVDLDACSGCKACVSACHSLNGLGRDETWRSVGVVMGVDASGGYQQTVTTACHHCEDPACLLGCPARAYEKDAETGIVRHLDDQCIGCRYCVLTCPYEVPNFEPSTGIVRKCDLCADRLGAGEAPACAQGCPSRAISIDIVSTGRAPTPLLPRADPGLPDEQLTRPTTTYVSSRSPDGLRPNDAGSVKPKQGHLPLAAMLVLVQLSVGALGCAAFGAESSTSGSPLLSTALAAALVGLAASVTHLGRPVQAPRAVLGWRTSWMSREILAFGAYVALLVAAVAASFVGSDAKIFAWLALAAGLGATGCSIGVYAVTGRPWWSIGRTTLAFLSTTVLLGAAAGAATGALAAWTDGASLPGAVSSWAWLAGATAAGRTTLRAMDRGGGPALERSRALLAGPLRSQHRARRALTVAGVTLLLTGALVGPPGAAVLAVLAGVAALLAGESMDRHLFFRAEAAPGMPGL